MSTKGYGDYGRLEDNEVGFRAGPRVSFAKPDFQEDQIYKPLSSRKQRDIYSNEYSEHSYDLPPPLPPKTHLGKAQNKFQSNNPFSTGYEKRMSQSLPRTPPPSSSQGESSYPSRGQPQRQNGWVVWYPDSVPDPTSPTSSTNTQHSNQKVENPFGN